VFAFLAGLHRCRDMALLSVGSGRTDVSRGGHGTITFVRRSLNRAVGFQELASLKSRRVLSLASDTRNPRARRFDGSACSRMFFHALRGVLSGGLSKGAGVGKETVGLTPLNRLLNTQGS
jgi:hypothetical protein